MVRGHPGAPRDWRERLRLQEVRSIVRMMRNRTWQYRNMYFAKLKLKLPAVAAFVRLHFSREELLEGVDIPVLLAGTRIVMLGNVLHVGRPQALPTPRPKATAKSAFAGCR